MIHTTFILISKKELTHDVYELMYTCPDFSEESPKAGQYVMFQLAPGLNRAYSFSDFSRDSFTLIIKRIPEGKGSTVICDAEIGTQFSGILSLGHFILRDTPVSKCFIGTGTGFAPLYCQILRMIELGLTQLNIAFIFGVREERDMFYIDEIKVLKNKFNIFESHYYLSRENIPEFSYGYVIDWITPESILPYNEFYLCGSPAMVKSAREKLEALGVTKERIFWEQF